MKYAECPFCQKTSMVDDDGNLVRECRHAIMTYVDSGWMKSDGPTIIRFSLPNRSIDEDVECFDDDTANDILISETMAPIIDKLSRQELRTIRGLINARQSTLDLELGTEEHA